MSRHNDELQQIHDRLLQLAEASSGQRRPLNVKRKVNVSRQGSKCSGPKLGVQDFVRMDPGYTAEIEHLVYPANTQKKRSPPPPPPPPLPPQQQQPPSSFNPRSRLAEMFALSRHIEKSSIERQEIMKNRIASQMNRSMDSATTETPRCRQLSSTTSSSIDAFKRSTTSAAAAAATTVYSVDETAFRQNSIGKISNRTSPLGGDIDKSVNRGGPNVSILHVRNNTEPWDKDGSIVPTAYSASAAARSYFASSRSTTASSIPPFTKHQSLTNSTIPSNNSTTAQQKWSNSPSFHSGAEVNSPGIFSFGGSCQRELSPVRWCDREVDGVYLGKSGWVQVQQRSLDDNRRSSYSNNLTAAHLTSASLQSNRTGIKLANYHFNSEPNNKCSNFSRASSLVEPQIIESTTAHNDNNNKSRPSYLLLQKDRNCERKLKTPSPLLQSRSFSPPSVTPIISPPPAFQDKNKSPTMKSRTFFSGKTPFLPRSNAIVDSDNSPPHSPLQWRTTAPNAPSLIVKPKPVIRTSPGIEKPPRATVKKVVPQTKSLEDTTASRRTQFKQKYGSSSSSSSSMGFRSLDSCLNRPNNAVMPRLSENTDSSIDVYEDADEEDNNSSSAMNSIPLAEYSRKLSPSGRTNRTTHYRNQLRRSPAGSDSNKHSPTTSSSSSSNEFLSRSPTSQQTIRRNLPTRPTYQPSRPSPQPQQDDSAASQRVRRSRSLQLPERIAQQPIITKTQMQQQQQQQHQPIKMSGNHYMPGDRKQYTAGGSSSAGGGGRGEILEEDLLREAAVVSGFVYGNRSRAAAQALLMHRYNNNISLEEKGKEYNKPMINNDLTVYYIGNNKNERHRLLVRGATSPNLPTTSKSSFDVKPSATCNYENCSFWPHCAHRNNSSIRDSQFVLRPSQTYPSHQRSFDSAIPNEAVRSAAIIDSRKSQRRSDNNDSRIRKSQELRKISPSRPSSSASATGGGNNVKRNGSTEIPTSKSSPRTSNVSGSSSGSDIWLTASKVSSRKGSGTSTPVEPFSFADQRLLISSRPGSAPNQELPGQSVVTSPAAAAAAAASNLLAAQRRSMSLPKSFLQTGGEIISPRAANIRSGQIPWQQRQGTESFESSPGSGRKIPTPEIVHTAPVTPLHESRVRGRSPLGTNRRTTKAASTPHLSDDYYDYTRNCSETNQTAPQPPPLPGAAATTTTTTTHYSALQRNVIEINSKNQNKSDENCAPSSTNETVLQKFCKTFSLRFPHRKSTQTNNKTNTKQLQQQQQQQENDDTASDAVPSEDDDDSDEDENEDEQQQEVDRRREGTNEKEQIARNEHRSRFGPLIWRSSKERKKVNKSARSAKCNSGDSGIQIEIPDGNGILGDSSESHDTDGPVFDSPPMLRRKPPGRNPQQQQRPHSDLINRVFIDKFKTDLKQAQPQLRSTATKQVRRSRSDLGGQRLLGWEQRQAARRLLRNMSSPHHHRPLSPRKRPPDEIDSDAVVILRKHGGHGAPPQRPALRRSLSQPIDIDKLSPLISRKTTSDHVRTVFASEDEHDNRINSIGSNTSEDEDTMSDSDVSSVTSFNARKKSLELTQTDEDIVVLAEAVFDHVAIENDELAFRAGNVIEIEDMADREWWWGSTNGKSGWFPAQFVRLRVSQEDTVEDCLAAIASGRSVSSQIRRRTSISLLSNDQVRTSVVRELVHTERDFVKVLQDVAEGYLSECRKRKDMFTDEQIATIFINLEEILKFQKAFLKNLETCVDWELPHKSCIGQCFLNHSDGFKMYSDYCNSHPMATATLQELYQYNNYSKFFEACRLMRGLIEIPLDGYLLTPVQRICKYPLQLAELLKYTRTDHEDYVNIKQALEAMRGVAMLINERKRRMESLEKLAGWQRRVEGWEDEDLIETSSQLIHHGEVIRVTSGMWTNNITLFLFDHQLIYCKKDILKRSIYVYKGRLCLDTSEIQDVPDGKDSNLNVTVRHAIKLTNQTKDKWLMFCCRSLKEKQRWLDAFVEERQLVAKDLDDGLELSLATRNLARVAAYRQKRPPRKLRSGKELKRQSRRYIGSSMLQINMASTNSILSRKMGTWFNFGAGKKLRHRDVS